MQSAYNKHVEASSTRLLHHVIFLTSSILFLQLLLIALSSMRTQSEGGARAKRDVVNGTGGGQKCNSFNSKPKECKGAGCSYDPIDEVCEEKGKAQAVTKGQGDAKVLEIYDDASAAPASSNDEIVQNSETAKESPPAGSGDKDPLEAVEVPTKVEGAPTTTKTTVTEAPSTEPSTPSTTVKPQPNKDRKKEDKDEQPSKKKSGDGDPFKLISAALGSAKSFGGKMTNEKCAAYSKDPKACGKNGCDYSVRKMSCIAEG